MLVCTAAISELYNITVTCTIHPDSTADQCLVMAMTDDGKTRKGKIHICTYIHICMYVCILCMYRCMYIYTYVQIHDSS